MTEYTFTLVFAVGGRDADADAVVERLGAAGCDDAVVGMGKRGRLALEFTREAENAARAVGSAVSNVRWAVPDAVLSEASPDLVGLTEVASLLGVTRQNVRKLIVSCDAPEPVPVHEGKPTIWRLAGVLRWLAREKRYPISPELLELAEATMQVNLAVEARDADPRCAGGDRRAAGMRGCLRQLSGVSGRLVESGLTEASSILKARTATAGELSACSLTRTHPRTNTG